MVEGVSKLKKAALRVCRLVFLIKIKGFGG
jgi:hypothetical protein